MTIGERIRELRIAKEYSQRQLGELININQTTVASYENGRTDPGGSILVKLTEIFGVSLDYLLGVNTANDNDLDRQILAGIKRLSEQDRATVETIIAALAAKANAQSQ